MSDRIQIIYSCMMNTCFHVLLVSESACSRFLLRMMTRRSTTVAGVRHVVTSGSGCTYESGAYTHSSFQPFSQLRIFVNLFTSHLKITYWWEGSATAGSTLAPAGGPSRERTEKWHSRIQRFHGPHLIQNNFLLVRMSMHR